MMFTKSRNQSVLGSVRDGKRDKGDRDREKEKEGVIEIEIRIKRERDKEKEPVRY